MFQDMANRAVMVAVAAMGSKEVMDLVVVVVVMIVTAVATVRFML